MAAQHVQSRGFAAFRHAWRVGVHARQKNRHVGACWPDRLIGNLPNVYLYAANNPSEATLATRRSNAITVTHLIPPLASAGLYKGLVDLKDSLTRWRSMDVADDAQAELETLIRDQAGAVDLKADDISKL